MHFSSLQIQRCTWTSDEWSLRSHLHPEHNWPRLQSYGYFPNVFNTWLITKQQWLLYVEKSIIRKCVMLWQRTAYMPKQMSNFFLGLSCTHGTTMFVCHLTLNHSNLLTSSLLFPTEAEHVPPEAPGGEFKLIIVHNSTNSSASWWLNWTFIHSSFYPNEDPHDDVEVPVPVGVEPGPVGVCNYLLSLYGFWSSASWWLNHAFYHSLPRLPCLEDDPHDIEVPPPAGVGKVLLSLNWSLNSFFPNTSWWKGAASRAGTST